MNGDMKEINDRIVTEINEDKVIKEIMLSYPELYDLLEYNEFTIKERLEMNPYYYQQFRLLWVKERAKLYHIELIMNEYTGNLYDKLRFHNEIKLGKIEVEKYMIPKDEKYIWYKKLYNKQTKRVEVYEAIKEAFKQQGFQMGHFIKVLQG